MYRTGLWRILELTESEMRDGKTCPFVLKGVCCLSGGLIEAAEFLVLTCIVSDDINTCYK